MAAKKNTKIKEENSKPKEDDFNITEAEKIVNPLLLPGFQRFLLGKQVKNMDDFKKYYEIYKGVNL